MTRKGRSLLALGAAAAACSQPDDGVLALTFTLAPPPPIEGLAGPSEADLGLPAWAFATGGGRCDFAPPSGTGLCTLHGLVALPPVPDGPRTYAFELILYRDRPLPPGFDARAVDRLTGPPDPENPGPAPQPRVLLALLTPDTTSVAVAQFPDLDRVLGGEVVVRVPQPAGAPPRRIVVLDGRVGNVSSASASGPAPAPSGHHH